MTDAPFADRLSGEPTQTPSGTPADNGRKVVLWLLAGLVVLFGGAYVAGYFLTGDRIARGTTIEGVAVGGLSPAAATVELEEGLADRVTEPLTVTVDERRREVRPARAGLAVDVEASVDQVATGRSWNPTHLWEYFAGGEEYDAVVTVDDERLDAALDGVAGLVEQPATEGAVAFVRGRAEATYPEPGVGVDREAAREALVAAFPAPEAGEDVLVDLPVAEVPAEVSEEEVSRAMREFANPAMSAAVIFGIGGEDVILRPDRFSKALSMEATDGRLEPVVDEKRLVRLLEGAMKSSAVAPVDATVRLVDGEPRVVPGRNGVTFDEEQVVAAFPELLTRAEPRRRLEVETVVKEPEFTTEDARALGVKERVSEFTTFYPHADYRNVNLGRAAEIIDGTLLKPGDVFSLNGIVGERTAENGFTKGFIISNGVFKEDFGGGVSQVATTTFNAMFFAGLEDVEHKPHSFYIDRYPVGREATVAWPSVDLAFRNDTDYGVLVEAFIEPSSPGGTGAMTVRMYSTKVWDIESRTSERYNFTSPQTRRLSGPECVPNEGYGGFDIDVTRIFRRPGSDEVVRREVFNTTYTPSDTVICESGGDGT